ncbi:hypothetical protein KAJ27_17540 [bacterium]|nr:hypothetical protein [bacterium]
MKGMIDLVVSPETAIDLMVYIEKYGQDFYRSAGVKSEDAKVKELFSALAEDEREHIEHYKILQEEISSDHTSTTSFIGDYGHFLELIAEEITSDLYFKKNLTPINVINMARHYEKDSVLLINSLRHLFKTNPAREIVDSVFNDEKHHYFELKQLLKSLQFKLQEH